MKLLNAFSLQMIKEFPATVQFVEVADIPKDLESCVGHKDTAQVLGVKFNRVSVSLEKDEIFYIAQLQGGRLPEGTTELPEGFSFKFLKGKVM